MHPLPDWRDFFRELVIGAREAMIIADDRGVIRFENRAATLLTGHGDEDRTGRAIFEFVHPEDHHHLYAALERRGDPRDPATLIDCRARRADGRTIPIELNLATVQIGGVTHVLMHLHDVSERVELHARLRHAHKLSALGHLTNGIADDLARVMATIRSQLDHLPTSEAPPFFLRVVRRAAETGAALAQQLKAFADMPPAFREQVDVHALVNEIRRSIGDDVWLDIRLDAASAVVRTDRELLRQALRDLALGFMRAMPEGSVVSVKTKNRSISRDVAWRSRRVPVEYLVIELSNTARGVPVEAPCDLFDPMVTPPMSAAIVLALVSLDDVASQAGGYVEISTNGGGATLVGIYLPVQ
jgi:PAS domain S-box-containing protein